VPDFESEQPKRATERIPVPSTEQRPRESGLDILLHDRYAPTVFTFHVGWAFTIATASTIRRGRLTSAVAKCRTVRYSFEGRLARWSKLHRDSDSPVCKRSRWAFTRTSRLINPFEFFVSGETSLMIAAPNITTSARERKETGAAPSCRPLVSVQRPGDAQRHPVSIGVMPSLVSFSRLTTSCNKIPGSGQTSNSFWGGPSGALGQRGPRSTSGHRDGTHRRNKSAELLIAPAAHGFAERSHPGYNQPVAESIGKVSRRAGAVGASILEIRPLLFCAPSGCGVILVARLCTIWPGKRGKRFDCFWRGSSP
jgi:hypothetical protein